MNKDLSRKFTLPKWEAKNTYLHMFTRRVFGGLARRPFYPPSFWRTGGLEGLPAVHLAGLTPFIGSQYNWKEVEGSYS